MKRLFGGNAVTPVITHSMVEETIDLGNVDGRKVRLVITNGYDKELQVCCAEGERDIMKFTIDGWHALERRVLEGLQAIR